MSKVIKQEVLVITMEEGSKDIRVDFNEGDLPINLVLTIMEGIIKEHRSREASRKTIN